ncbi:MAG: cellulase family glycosylhydrolase [Cellvibrio sp.]|uniref:cellulase family glycosylhydrolase n=1 Tax=Cellvibrio sp. TaxID=1965322 RepID=UPI0027275F3F|nr:cellulase family glycosylhydrolase [Cellvibrio sp.]
MITPPKKNLSLLAVLSLCTIAMGYSTAASAACSYNIDNEWNTGATGNIKITNSTATAINGWSVNWQYATNRLTGSWNANLSGSNPYTATNMGWNGTIPPGQTVSFGFQLNKNGGALERPTVNGAVCSGGPASSAAPSSRSSTPSSISSSSTSASCVQQCNWYGTVYPLCVTTTSGWGYENNRSCISRTTCASQPSPFGVTAACGNSSSVVSSSRSSSSSLIPSSRSSSSSLIPSSSSRSSASVISSSVSSSRSSTPPSSRSSSSSSSVAPGGVFRVDATGNITKNGTVFPVKCGNWFGLEGQHEPKNAANNPDGAPMELYVGNMWWANTGRTIQQTMTEIKAQGINVIRLPIAPQTLDPTDPQGRGDVQAGGVLKNHASVRQTNARQAMEDFIKLADQNNLEVIVDIHSCSNYVGWRAGRLDAKPPYADANRESYDFKREGYSCAPVAGAGVVVHEYNETKWLANLRDIAGLSAQLGVDNIIGIDIFNEPWDYTWAEWKTLSDKAYQAISAVNPDVLIFVEGVSATAGGVKIPHGSEDLNPNWGENMYGARDNPLNIPQDRLVLSPHTYGPSVFVQKQFMDPAQVNCTELEGDEAGNSDCNIVINKAKLSEGWDEHFGYLRDQGFAMVVGEFGGNMDWPAKGSVADRSRWSHITTNVDQQWQQAFVSYMKEKKIQACYWSINPESGDTGGWYLHSHDPESNPSGWGTWLNFDARKTTLLKDLWGN